MFCGRRYHPPIWKFSMTSFRYVRELYNYFVVSSDLCPLYLFYSIHFLVLFKISITNPYISIKFRLFSFFIFYLLDPLKISFWSYLPWTYLVIILIYFLFLVGLLFFLRILKKQISLD